MLDPSSKSPLSLTVRQHILQNLKELFYDFTLLQQLLPLPLLLLLLLLLLLQAVLYGRCQQLPQWLRNRAGCCCWISLAEVTKQQHALAHNVDVVCCQCLQWEQDKQTATHSRTTESAYAADSL
jgi:hypothetical protein